MQQDSVADKIFEFIEQRGQATAHELARHFGVTRQAIHRHLKSLFDAGRIYKIGRPPKVFYAAKEQKKVAQTGIISNDLQRTIEEHFAVITPSGERMNGISAFSWWCGKQKLPFEKTAREYEKTIRKYEAYKKDGFIDGLYKVKHTFGQAHVDKLFYLDFYAIERFGKTKLGQLLLYAKQSQNPALIAELVENIKPKIAKIIKKFNVNAVGFIPPTVKREVQLMKELERGLALPLPVISLVKIKTPIIVPQKTLTKLEDRIENAKNTIVVNETKKYRTILLIDDALGSGATLNETAKKIKERALANTVIGLAITGSFSGFEVISEV